MSGTSGTGVHGDTQANHDGDKEARKITFFGCWLKGVHDNYAYQGDDGGQCQMQVESLSAHMAAKLSNLRTVKPCTIKILL